MGLFSKSEPEVLQSPIFDMVDEEPLISMDAREANLFVKEHIHGNWQHLIRLG